MKETVKFDFCEAHVYDRYLVVVINEGMTLLPKHNDVLNHMANVYFTNKEFVYITHRLNSYAVDPTIYVETSKIKNLIGLAVVSKDYKAISNVEIEKLFLKKPLKTFTDLKAAMSWADSILKR